MSLFFFKATDVSLWQKIMEQKNNSISPQTLKSQLNVDLLRFSWACTGSPVQGTRVRYLLRSCLKCFFGKSKCNLSAEKKLLRTVLDIHWNSHELEVGFSKHYRWRECHGCFKSLQICVKTTYTLRIISTEQTPFEMCPF